MKKNKSYMLKVALIAIAFAGPLSLTSVNSKVLFENQYEPHQGVPSKLVSLPGSFVKKVNLTDPQTLEHLGEMPSDITRFKGSGKKLTITDALKDVVPKDWSVYVLDQKIKNISLVNFAGGNRPWPIVLEEILNANALQGKLNWKSRELSIGARSDGF